MKSENYAKLRRIGLNCREDLPAAGLEPASVTLSLEAATEPNSKTDRVALGGRGTSTAPFMPGASARGLVVSTALDVGIEEDEVGDGTLELEARDSEFATEGVAVVEKPRQEEVEENVFAWHFEKASTGFCDLAWEERFFSESHMQRLRSSVFSAPNLKKKYLNSRAAIQDTFFFHKGFLFLSLSPFPDTFERHRVVFTVGTSIASVATACFVKGFDKVRTWVENRGLKRVCSYQFSKRKCNAELIISKLGLSDFDVLIIGDECERGKPYPNPYLKALEVINLLKDHAFVFEVYIFLIGSWDACYWHSYTKPNDLLRKAKSALLINDYEDPKLWVALEEFDKPGVEKLKFLDKNI
ncbi:hypothetical protein V8G54_014689 [Vigna mungo]|uniref:Uncharacterized protein n=1 Tax=Vigna mungo TaxID=3915 RepID=A0AAQ3RZP4_VIGMU